MDLNKVMIIGRLTRDPELRTTTSGMNVCNMGVATGYSYLNKQTNQRVESTEFHNVVLFARLAEVAHQYLKKGGQVYVEGRLQTRSWEGQDGQKKNRTEIIADNIIMLGKPSGMGANSSAASSPATSQATAASRPAAANSMEQVPPVEELPTIQQGEDVDVEGIPF